MAKGDPRLLVGHEFGVALIAAGVIRRDERVTRIVIDAAVDEPVRLYVQRIGDERILDALELLQGTTQVPAQEFRKPAEPDEPDKQPGG